MGDGRCCRGCAASCRTARTTCAGSAGACPIPRGSRLRAANATLYEQRVAAYLQRYREIESGRFSSLYDRDDLFSAPNANVKLGLFVTKIFGLPDAFLFTFGTILAGGWPGIVLFGTVLGLTAMPLWRSRRPARTWLKLLAWPGLASALVWAAILIMAIYLTIAKRLGAFDAL